MCRLLAYIFLCSHLGAICAVQFYISTYLSFTSAAAAAEDVILKFINSFLLFAAQFLLLEAAMVCEYQLDSKRLLMAFMALLLLDTATNNIWRFYDAADFTQLRVICTTLHPSQIES